MSIVTNGWGGASAISTWGWGTPYYEYELLPVILADFITSHAYTCVGGREYVEVSSRIADTLVSRLKPSIISQRSYDEAIIRASDAEDALARSKGWPWQEDPCLDD